MVKSGLAMCIAGALSFGLLACVSKIAERRKCNPSALVVGLFGWAALIMLLRTLSLAGSVRISWRVVAVAILFGIFAAVATFAFQRSIEIGNVTVGWLIMNLSAGVPTLISIWAYSEKFTILKLIAFCLAVVSLLLLFQGNRLEARERETSSKVGP
jgi:drug/metabolite transporter (DMT)-like permease